MEIIANSENNNTDIVKYATQKQRGGSLAQWEASDYVLKEKEIGVAVDTGEFRVGDGVHTWGELQSPYCKMSDTITEEDINKIFNS